MDGKRRFKARCDKYGARARRSARIRGAQAKRDRRYRYGGGE